MAEPTTLQAVALFAERVSGRVIGALHQLLGFQYAESAEHYKYSATALSGTADATGTTYTASFRVTQEAAFVCTSLTVGTRIVAGTGAGAFVGISGTGAVAGDLPDAPFTMRITDGGSDRQLSNEEVDAFLAYGFAGSFPGTWARPRYFKPNSVITIALTSLKTVPAATTWRHKVLFSGWKVYLRTPPDLAVRRG